MRNFSIQTFLKTGIQAGAARQCQPSSRGKPMPLWGGWGGRSALGLG